MRLPVAAALLALAARPARAEAAERFALRLGVAPAVGSAAADVPVSDEIRLQFPIQLDLLGRFGRSSAGAYGSWGSPAPAAATARAPRSPAPGSRRPGRSRVCAGRSRGSASARLRVGDRGRAARGSTVTTTWRGFELLAAQGGLEWRVAPMVAVGPFLAPRRGPLHRRRARHRRRLRVRGDRAKGGPRLAPRRRARAARPRRRAVNGTLVELEVDSPALAGNPLGDPARRTRPRLRAARRRGGAARRSTFLHGFTGSARGWTQRVGVRARPSRSGSTRSSRRARSRRSSGSSRTA